MAFSPDGSKIVSGSVDKTIKVWDASPRPFNATEWEGVDISGMEKDSDGGVNIDGLGYIKSNYWKNTVTGDLRKEYSTAGELLALEPIKVWVCRCVLGLESRILLLLAGSFGSYFGSRDGEDQRPRPVYLFCWLQPRWD